MKRISTGFFLIMVLFSGGCSRDTPESRPRPAESLPSFQPSADDIQGDIIAEGSNTLTGVMLLLGEQLQQYHPELRVYMTGSGSQDGPQALTDGRVQLAPMSRTMNQQERESFREAKGHEPVAVPIAVDAIAVFVHPDNPLQQISLSELSLVYAEDPDADPIVSWNKLLGTSVLHGERIDTVGRRPGSGTYEVFRRLVLDNRAFDPDRYRGFAGSSMVVRYVAEHPAAIGYSGIGFVSTSVKPLAISRGNTDPAVSADPDTAVDGRYPLSRMLYLYVDPFRMPDHLREVLSLALSFEGQEAIARDGFFPLPPDTLFRTRERLGL